MRVLGCDPGLTGAVALWDDALDVLVVIDAPTLTVAVGRSRSRTVYQDAVYANRIRDLSPDVIIIEQVNGIPGQSASASFNFGVGFGLLRGIAAALGVPMQTIAPQTWRSAFRVPQGKDGSRLRASQVFPLYASLFARKRDDGRAEAALMARCYHDAQKFTITPVLQVDPVR